ncbi:MAG: WbqC family protein [Fluviicola sp.]|jgi:hypothetical protein
MKVCFPTAYFGNIPYFSKLVHFDQVYIEQYEHFVKQTLRTRCELTGSQGVFRLSVPVSRPFGNKTPMHAVSCLRDGWQKQHEKALYAAYGSSAFYEYYQPDVQRLINSTDNLIEMNTDITRFLLNEWGFNTQLLLTDSYHHNFDLDLRGDEFLPDQQEPVYTQVLFSSDQIHYAGLSVLDLLFCEGPMGRKVLEKNSQIFNPITQ